MLCPFIPLLPNRVQRNYLGGYLLDQIEHNPSPHDGNRPEDWLASTVRAVNPGLSAIRDEGLSVVETELGERVQLRELFEIAPEYYLGCRHFQQFGPHLGFLAKLLDSSMRLHVQAHPTAAFAREHLKSPWGKLEAYVIMALRDEQSAYIRLGFQRPPSPTEWRRIIIEQDIAAMDACFDPIPVHVGEVWLVPGGLPHAIGEGVLMLEVMEPSDLVVRCEFEREGVIVPPEARFMRLTVDMALQVFDYTPLAVAQVQAKYRIAKQRISPNEQLLIGHAQTDCFCVTRVVVVGNAKLSSIYNARIGIVASGRGTLTIGEEHFPLESGSRFLLAASAPDGELRESGGEPLQILFCSPAQSEQLSTLVPKQLSTLVPICHQSSGNHRC